MRRSRKPLGRATGPGGSNPPLSAFAGVFRITVDNGRSDIVLLPSIGKRARISCFLEGNLSAAGRYGRACWVLEATSSGKSGGEAAANATTETWLPDVPDDPPPMPSTSSSVGGSAARAALHHPGRYGALPRRLASLRQGYTLPRLAGKKRRRPPRFFPFS